MVNIADNEDKNLIMEQAKQTAKKLVKRVITFKVILAIGITVAIIVLLSAIIWFFFKDSGVWGKEEKGRPNIYTDNVKMDPKEGIVIDKDAIIKQALLDMGFTEDEIAEMSEQEIISRFSLIQKLNRTITSLDECTAAEILWCLSEEYSNFLDSPEQLEFLLKAELITQYPYIDGLDDSKTNGVIKFYRYSNTGEVDFKSSYANAGANNEEEQQEESEEEPEIDASKIFYIGDSWMAGLSLQKYVNKDYFWYKSGEGPKYFVENIGTLSSKMKSDASAIVLMLGLNATSDTANMEKLIDLITTNYPDKQLYVLKVFHVGSAYKMGRLTASKMNANVDTFNSAISTYCSTKNNVLFVDTTMGLLDTNGYLADQYLDKSLSGNDKNFHLNKGGYQQWYYNIEQALKAGGGLRTNINNQEAYRIKYTSRENFDALYSEYESSGNRDIFKYFTLDDEGNVEVATWSKTTGNFTTQNGNKSIGEIQNTYDPRYQQTSSGVSFVEYRASITKINYKSMASKYTIPFEYLWALLVEGEDYKFVERVANLAYNTEFNIGIYDSVNTSTNVDKNYYTRVVTKTTTRTNSAGETSSKTTTSTVPCVDISTITTETDMISYDVAYANTWIVEIWTKYIAKNFSGDSNKDVTIMEGQKSNLSEDELKERLENFEENEDKEELKNAKDGEEVLINTPTVNEVENTEISEAENLTVTEQTSVNNSYERTTPELREKIDVDPNTGDNFVKALRESENAYRLLTNNGTLNWLCEILEENEDTANMVDLTRALIKKAIDPDAEIDFDFSIFSPEGFSDMSTISGEVIGWAFTCTHENCPMWNYMHGKTDDYKSSPYIYKYVTEDKTQYIMHDVNNKGNRNFGYGVMFYYNKLHVFYHQKEFAERGVDITAPEYQQYGAKLSAEIVDGVSLELWQNQKENVKKDAQKLGVELTDYQLDALTDLNYQYGSGAINVIKAFKQYGLNESAIKNSHAGMNPSNYPPRSSHRLHLFMTGEYIAGDGSVLNVADFSGSGGSGFTKGGITTDEEAQKLEYTIEHEWLNTKIHYGATEGMYQGGPFVKWWKSPINTLDPFQCTWWAYGRASQYLDATGKKYKVYPKDSQGKVGNGGKWYEKNKQYGWFNYGSQPRPNSLIVWKYAGGAGHVAYVEGVTSDGIYISHAGGAKRWFGVQKIPLNGFIWSKNYTLEGYIYLDEPK